MTIIKVIKPSEQIHCSHRVQLISISLERAADVYKSSIFGYITVVV